MSPITVVYVCVVCVLSCVFRRSLEAIDGIFENFSRNVRDGYDSECELQGIHSVCVFSGGQEENRLDVVCRGHQSCWTGMLARLAYVCV